MSHQIHPDPRNYSSANPLKKSKNIVYLIKNENFSKVVQRDMNADQGLLYT